MRAWIYDRFLIPLTTGWYAEVIERLPEHALLLDVGIGTGGALCGSADRIIARDIRVVGVDIDADYIRQARKHLEEHGLDDRVEARLESIYDHQGGPYDGVYFAASFMLLPDPPAALRHVLRLLKPEGKVYFTQTFHQRRSKVAEVMKPMLKKVTTIDFGKVTYEQDFVDLVEGSGMQIVEMTELGRRGLQSYRMVAGRPRPEAPLA
jgi:ubiquinone/menaquinone biosynthesis C-methylase UbiE